MTTTGDEHCVFSSETEILVETNHCMNSIVRFWFYKSLVEINDIIQMIVWIGLLSNHWGFLWFVSTKISVSEEKTQCSSPVVVIFHFSSSQKIKTVLRSSKCEWVNEWVNKTQQIYTLL
jgi:hypothetical protein